MLSARHRLLPLLLLPLLLALLLLYATGEGDSGPGPSDTTAHATGHHAQPPPHEARSMHHRR